MFAEGKVIPRAMQSHSCAWLACRVIPVQVTFSKPFFILRGNLFSNFTKRTFLFAEGKVIPRAMQSHSCAWLACRAIPVQVTFSKPFSFSGANCVLRSSGVGHSPYLSSYSPLVILCSYSCEDASDGQEM